MGRDRDLSGCAGTMFGILGVVFIILTFIVGRLLQERTIISAINKSKLVIKCNK